MSDQFTIQISKQSFHKLERIAARTGQSVEGVASSLIESYFVETPVELLLDHELLALAGSACAMEEQKRLSILLYKNTEGLLDAEGRKELALLMSTSDRELLRKMKAREELLKRGLMSS